MKVIIAGSRDIVSIHYINLAIQKSGFDITEVVSGGARGVDQLGERWAKENQIPVRRFLPDWKKYGKKAGILRNKEMADYGEALIACWDKKSSGTKNMIETAKKQGLKVYVLEINNDLY